MQESQLLQVCHPYFFPQPFSVDLFDTLARHLVDVLDTGWHHVLGQVLFREVL